MSANAIPLGVLNPGSRAVIKSVDGLGPFKRQLMDMGLTPGAEVYMEGAAPLGDPIIVRARGARLCLRRSEAGAVSVMPCSHDCPRAAECPRRHRRAARGPNRWRHRGHGRKRRI